MRGRILLFYLLLAAMFAGAVVVSVIALAGSQGSQGEMAPESGEEVGEPDVAGRSAGELE